MSPRIDSGPQRDTAHNPNYHVIPLINTPQRDEGQDEGLVESESFGESIDVNFTETGFKNATETYPPDGSQNRFQDSGKGPVADVTQDDFKNDIHDAMLETADGRSYIPNMALNAVITGKKIHELVMNDQDLNIDDSEKKALISEIAKRARTLLAIVVYSGLKIQCLKLIIDRGRNDGSIPLSTDDKCHPKSRTCVRIFTSVLRQQGSFKPAHFNKPGHHQDLDRSVELPIHYHAKTPANSDCTQVREPEEVISKDAACCGSGASSRVYRVRIHRCHHKLTEDRDAFFALKEFTTLRSVTSFERESSALAELRGKPHPHMVTYLATFSQDHKYSMLFPYAECNLREYMSNKKFDATENEEILWLLRQFRGLADALKHLHGLPSDVQPSDRMNLQLPPSSTQRAGWHHDIKPENILYFALERQLRIADFGSSKIQTYGSGSILTFSPHGTKDYEPPESFTGEGTGRKYDIWSLGCVFLEVLTWALHGHGEDESFKTDRLARRCLNPEKRDKIADAGFWQMDKNGKVKLRDPVTRRILGLRSKAEELKRHAFGKVLDKVHDSMLNLEPDNRALEQICRVLDSFWQG